ncbi:MAG: hypothetical protein PHW92_04080 [Lutibacter sp.]|nr:hypothetical protein [Lutibacter sp.]
MKSKKNKLTNLLKKVILLFGITLLFFGCDSEETINAQLEEQFQGELVEKVTFEEIKNEPIFSKAFADFKLDKFENQFNAKSTDSTNFKINLNSINKIEKDHATTYTFLVEDNSKELPPFAFKNLVIEITPNKTQGYFITYYPTNEYIQNKINNIETDFIANISISDVKEDITELLNQITSSKSRTSQKSNCTKYLIIETVCTSGQHWPGDSCSLSGSNRAQTYSIPVLDDGCDSSGGDSSSNGNPINIGDNQNVSIPGGGSSSGGSNPPSVNSGSTFPNVPSGIGDMNSDNIDNLLSYNPSILENKTNYFNYLKNIANYCNASGQLDLGSLLYNYGINSNLNNQELVIVSSKAKQILGILAKNNFTDIDRYSLTDKKIIAQNSLFISFLPDIKDLGINIPQTAEEWKVFFEILKPILLEVGIEFIPLGGVYNSAVDSLNGIDSSDWTQITIGVVGIIMEFTPADQIKNLFKLVKNSKKGFKIFKLTRKFTNVIKDALDSGLKIVLDNNIIKFLDNSDTEIARIVNNTLTFKYTGFGGNIITNPNKTNTVIGKWLNQIENIWNTGLAKQGDNVGGLNILGNVPNGTVTEKWVFNKEWLDQAIARGDAIRVTANPLNIDNVFHIKTGVPSSAFLSVESLKGYLLNLSTTKIEDLGYYGRELRHLFQNGYSFNSTTKQFVK